VVVEQAPQEIESVKVPAESIVTVGFGELLLGKKVVPVGPDQV
jgi:hypothetical protein